jgi:hypothetical protein
MLSKKWRRPRFVKGFSVALAGLGGTASRREAIERPAAGDAVVMLPVPSEWTGQPHIECQRKPANSDRSATSEVGAMNNGPTMLQRLLGSTAAPAAVKPKPAPAPPTETPEQLRDRVRAALLRRRA